MPPIHWDAWRFVFVTRIGLASLIGTLQCTARVRENGWRFLKKIFTRWRAVWAAFLKITEARNEVFGQTAHLPENPPEKPGLWAEPEGDVW
jgi:hypothetical protein